jgi:octaprenyl-diphosphate synthase
MTLAAVKSAPEANVSTALDDLSLAMKPDMLAVNTLIIENMQSSVPLIPQLAGYLIASGGKRIRPLMTLAATRLFDADTKRPYQLAAAVEFIHTATLLHDDVVDESDQRRGKPSANTVFGNQSSVLVGDFLFSRAFELMVADGSIEVLRLLSNAAAVITEGEVLQLSIQNKLETTLDQYLEVIAAKTAVLFSAACEIGPVIAGQSDVMRKALHDYGHNLGMAFQIADDLLDYQADEAELGKTVGDDFREGKMTSPVIFAYQAASESEKTFWKRTFESHSITETDLQTAKAIIKSTKADQKTYDLALSFIENATKALSPVPASELKTTLENLASFVLTRKN